MAQQEQKKPNILVIMGDDIGMWNVGVYANGMMAIVSCPGMTFELCCELCSGTIAWKR